MPLRPVAAQARGPATRCEHRLHQLCLLDGAAARQQAGGRLAHGDTIILTENDSNDIEITV
jgi:hypothetical protein